MKPIHKAGAGGLTAGTIALSIAMFNHWEGRNYTAVHLPFDPPGVITACGGITNQDWPWLKEGMRLTEAQCQKAIAELVPRYAAPVIKCVPNFTTMPEYRQAAIISFVINLGPGKVCGTSIGRDLRAGRTQNACDAMTKYIAANGKRLQGLVNRRTDPVWGERAWCLRNDDAPANNEVITKKAPHVDIDVNRAAKADRGPVPAAPHYGWFDYLRNWWRLHFS